MIGCINFVEAAHIPDILREAGPDGMSVVEIARKVTEVRKGKGTRDVEMDPAKISECSCACGVGCADPSPTRNRSHSPSARDNALDTRSEAGRVREQPTVVDARLWQACGRVDHLVSFSPSMTFLVEH